jgi:hypothetical protein
MSSTEPGALPASPASAKARRNVASPYTAGGQAAKAAATKGKTGGHIGTMKSLGLLHNLQVRAGRKSTC